MLTALIYASIQHNIFYRNPVMTFSENFKQYIYFFVLACFLILPVAVFLLGEDFFRGQSDHIEETGMINTDCSLHISACEASFSEGGKITFSITPHPIKPLVPLDLTVKVENISAEKVFVNFEGIDMYMGFYRPELIMQESGAGSSLFQGKATLSVCTLEKMRWQANVIISTNKGLYVAPFHFEVDQS